MFLYKPRIKINISLFLFYIIIISYFFTIFPKAAENGENKTVRVGWFDYSEYQHTLQDGTIYGYNYEVYQEIAKKAGWDIEYIGGTVSLLYEKLLNDEIDLIGCLPINEKRAEECLFLNSFTQASYNSIYTSKNSPLAYDDFKAFNGINIGVLEDYDLKILEEYANQNKFSFNIKYYKTQSEIKNALLKGIIDAGIDEGFVSDTELRVISKFSNTPLYYFINKKNSELYSELKSIIDYITLENPDFIKNLNQKYFSNTNTYFKLTSEEYEFVKSCRVLNVMYNENWYPLEYASSKGFSGIISSIYEVISEMTGLNFNYFKGDKLYNNSADIISSVEYNHSSFNGRGFSLTNPFLSLALSMITRPDSVISSGKTATTINFYSYERLNYDFSFYNSAEECLNALLKKEVESVIINSYSATNLLVKNPYKSFITNPLQGFVFNLSIAVNNDLDPILISILNKAIASISTEEMTDIIVRNTISAQNIGFIESLNRVPPYIILFFTIILLSIIIVLAFLVVIRIKNEKDIQQLLETDRLTGLLNRRGFESEVKDILTRSPKSRFFTMIAFDISHFEMYNSLYGFSRGDELLCTVANVLKEECKEYEACARISADNFACLMNDENIDFIIKRITEINVKLQLLSGNNSLLISYGLREIRDRTLPISTMYDRAVIAKRTVKGNYNRNIAVYDNELYLKQAEDKILTDSMDQALKNGEFVAVYQPKYDVKTQKIVGAEALVRWYRPDGKIIPPNRFISLFESNGQISRLDNYMFETVCRYIALIIKKGIKPLPVSVNFSRAHLYELDFADNLLKITRDYNIPAHLLEIELTESAFINNQDLLIKIIGDLHDRNFLVSIDDFGSGYSSLNMIKDVNFDIMKLDRGFMSSTGENQRAADIIKCMIELAARLGIKTLAEGVETIEQFNFLRDIGCDMIQGYYFSKPVDSDKFVDMITNLLQEI